MPGHLTRRIVHAAVTPIVRVGGPAVASGFKHFLQFIGFGLLGLVTILVSWLFLRSGVPWFVVKSAVVVFAIAPMGFGLLVAMEQVRLTYETQDPSVYEGVEPFEQRRPADG